MSKLKELMSGSNEFVKVDEKNRFYYMLQQMQSNRWKITSIVLFLFFFIIFGINVAVFCDITIKESWKEMLLILLGAFVGNLNKVVDYWFNSEDRDKMLIQKVDEEDGVTLSNVAEFESPARPQPSPSPSVEPIVVSAVVEKKTEKVEIDEDGDGEEECLICGVIKPMG